MRSTKFKAALAALAAAAMLVVALPAPAAQAIGISTPVAGGYDLSHQQGVPGLAANEFVYDSARGEDAPTTSGTDAYPISYTGSMNMETLWFMFGLFRSAWLGGSGNTEDGWKAKTFSGTWNMSFKVDPKVVSVNQDFVTCAAVQAEIAKVDDNLSFGDIMRCTSVSYDGATGIYLAKFKLQYKDDPNAKVTGAMLDQVQHQPKSLKISTPVSALFVKQSNFVADTEFLMTEPHVDGQMTMDYFTNPLLPLTFNATGAPVKLKMIGSHDATFAFASDTPGKTLPQEVTDLTPAKKTMIVDGQVVTPPAPSKTSVGVDGGTWEFVKWSPANATMAGKNLEFTGTWAFTKNTSLTQFQFVTDTPGYALPDEVLDLLPPSLENKIGTRYTAPLPAQTEVTVENPDQRGTWTFQGWEPESLEITPGGNMFTADWTFVERELKDFDVSYAFTSGTPDKELPASVTALLPSKESVKEFGTALPAGVNPQLVEVDGGSWQFQGWSPSEYTNVTAPVTFTGKWNFVADPPPGEYPVTYQFVSGTDGQDLPTSVLDQLPSPTSAKDGDTVTAPAPAKPTVETDSGTWTFKGWDADSATVDGKPVAFTGTWTFEAKPVDDTFTFTIKHSYVPKDAGETLPKDVTDQLPGDVTVTLKKGETYTPPTPPESTVTTPDGVWSFVGWNPAKVVAGEANPAAARVRALAAAAEEIDVVGTWAFEAKATPTPTPEPSESATPTPTPTDEPTAEPTEDPTDEPTSEPSDTPSTSSTPGTSSAPSTSKAPVPPVSSTPGTEMPATGFNGLWIGLAALVIVALGVVALLISRARRRH